MAQASTAPAQRSPESLLPVNTPKLGMWIFLASEVMFFSALIAAFLMYRLRGPADANHVLNIPLTAFNTFVLLTSSMTVVLALAAAQRNDQAKLRLWLLVSLLFGGTFLSVQMIEYFKLFEEGLTINSNMFGTIFFTLTGFHGTHVFIGLLWLVGIIVQAFRGRFSATYNMSLEIFGLYWHFVDIVWIILFVIVYLI
ncbi:cytochrome c oxidase subunit 3 [Candidatus Amarolinea aalborgensis]|jgi:heme/copper-type cytochrome/quinol oxidase subunit 3|uniref:cytochrome c oxidase subunit 3 n=1 Tax=Candidatus Amarolinea aalborgensis TaxID=2249329 RepID=UPI003BFA37F2